MSSRLTPFALALFIVILVTLAGSGRLTAQAPPSIAGTIDVHTHSDPDSTKRVIDVIDLAKLARSRGMRGIVIKNHYESTASVAYLVRKEVPGIEVFGGITMDLTNGGVNPAAVENMTKITGGWGRIVWMPTFDSEATALAAPAGSQKKPFASVSRDGQLLPAVKEVIGIIAQHDMVLATGHSSAEEDVMLVHEGKRQGVRHMIITHAMNAPTRMSVPQMQEVAKDGAFVEFCYLSLIQRPQTAAEYAAAIRTLGPQFAIMSTDLGQANNPVHPDGLASFISAMLAQGFTQREIDLMTKDNPAKLLGLSVQ